MNEKVRLGYACVNMTLTNRPNKLGGRVTTSRGARKVTILTARRLGQPVTHFFKSMGLEVYTVPLGDANPEKKADWIEKQVSKGYDNAKEVYKGI